MGFIDSAMQSHYNGPVLDSIGAYIELNGRLVLKEPLGISESFVFE